MSNRIHPNQVEDWIKKTKLFKQHRHLREEISLHKYYESEKAGYDIGWERAAVDYLIRIKRDN